MIGGVVRVKKVDMERVVVGDKYDQSTLYEILKELIEIKV